VNGTKRYVRGCRKVRLNSACCGAGNVRSSCCYSAVKRSESSSKVRTYDIHSSWGHSCDEV
jgi:hypothetical protein